jgi:membrane-bound metal-dependent hydrolase YbcI (DUF457 family)
MTPLGHISVSYITGKSINYLSLPALIIGGVLPDIDVVSYIFGSYEQIHRTFTHSLFFVLLAALLSMLLFTKDKKIAFLSILMGGVLHLLFDFIIDTNPANGVGVMLFWPFSDQYISPFNLATETGATTGKGWHDLLEQSRLILVNGWLEIPFVLGAMIYYVANKRQINKRI